MAKIRAKLTVQSVTKYAYGTEEVKLAATYGTAPEDNSFAKATPSASLVVFIDNPSAQGVLQPGTSWYVDFTSADAPAAVPAPAQSAEAPADTAAAN